jgi:hypothetical protein
LKKKKANHPLAEALANVGKADVHTLPKEKESGGIALEASSYYRPSIYLDQGDFPGIKDFTAGQTVNLAITCEVRNVTTDDNGKDKSYNASLKIMQISDITPRKGD